MANAMRGEKSCEIDGVIRTFRPSFAAIMEIEDRLGGVVPLAQKIAAGDFGLREIAVILWAMDVARDGFSLDDMGEGLLRTGLADAAAVVRDLLAQVLTGADMGKPLPPVGFVRPTGG